MKPSTHKAFVFAGFGCGGVMVLLVLFALLVAKNEPTSSGTRPGSSESVGLLPSGIALDSLRALNVRLLTPHPARDDALAPTGSGNGAVRALAIWRGEQIATLTILFGDSFPAGSTERQAWLAAGGSYFVDTLLATARRPWRLDLAARDSGDVTAKVVPARPVLATTRAMLARAVLDLDGRRVAAADSLVRAVVTIARALQDDSRLSLVALGARIERDAAELRARHRVLWRGAVSTRVRAVLAHADSVSRLLGRLSFLVRSAGTDPGAAGELAVLAEDVFAPVALRRELVAAIADGWLENPDEMSRGISRRRREALERLDRQGDSLPPPVRAAVRAGLAFKDPGMLGRFKRMVANAAAAAS